MSKNDESSHGKHTNERCRHQMYVCQLDKLDPSVRKTIKERTDPEDVKKHGKYDVTLTVQTLEAKFPGCDIVAIVHDHDIKREKKTGKPILDDQGKTIPVPDHIHIGKQSKNSTSLKSFAEALHDPNTQNVENFDKKYKGARGVWENLVSYLFHWSKTAVKQGKYRYPFEWGVGNFDFRELVVTTYERVKKKEAAKLRRANGDRKAVEEEEDADLLEKVRTGEYQLADIAYHEDLQLAYARNKTKFDTVSEIWTNNVVLFQGLREQALLSKNTELLKKYDEKLKALHSSTGTSDAYYICGPSGSGKTFYAKFLGYQYDDSTFARGLFITDGDTHIFDGYNKQYCLVLDDARSDTLSPSSWLGTLDPNRKAKVMDARYKSSTATDLRYIAVTNTASLDTFVRYIKDSTDNGDAEDQYFRRFFRVVEVGEPISLGEGTEDVVVPYTMYRVKHEKGMDRVLNGAQYSIRLSKFNRNGDKGLRIFRKEENGNYRMDHYSDYYLHKEKTGKMLVPISELDKDEKPIAERHRVDHVLDAETKKAEAVLEEARKKNTTTSGQKVVVNGPF